MRRVRPTDLKDSYVPVPRNTINQCCLAEHLLPCRRIVLVSAVCLLTQSSTVAAPEVAECNEAGLAG